MYQTHGFPPELFENLAAERNLAFDWQGFREEMERHGLESGAGEKIVFKTGPIEALKKAVHETRFVGYETLEVRRRPRRRPDRRPAPLRRGERGRSAGADRSWSSTGRPFYGEMGGQVGDTGELLGDGFRFEVIDTQIDGALVLHRGHLREGRLELGQQVAARVNPERRQAIRRAAHRHAPACTMPCGRFSGEHAVQQGSKVDEDSLRFDFANPSAVSPEDLRADRGRGEPADLGGAARPLGPHAAGRGPAGRGHDALRREVSRTWCGWSRSASSARNYAAARIWTTRARWGCCRSPARRAWPPARGGSRP